MQAVDALSRWAAAAAEFVSGPFLMLLMLGTGLYLTIGLRFSPVRRFGHVVRQTLGTLTKKRAKSDHGISPLQAFCTALSGTVGVGNIAGVATALVAGGPGAIFWMWAAAILGMATKYCEIALSIHYRRIGPDGLWQGGPDVTMARGLKAPWMGALFAFFCMLASFGMGNAAQINALSSSMDAALGVPAQASGFVCAILLFLISLGGVKRVSAVAERIVPPMAALYLVGTLAILWINRAQLPSAISSIFACAFTPRSAASGAAGYAVARAMRYGVGRGLFSNEAGLGNAAIVHAAADTKSPHAQGLWGIMEVFLDTIVVCTLTALAILSTDGALTSGLDGAALSTFAFTQALGPRGGALVAICMALFAFSSMLSWSYYGERAACALFGGRVQLPYRLTFCAVAYLAAMMQMGVVWQLSDLFNAMMAVPNLIALLLLSKKAFTLSQFR